MALIDDIGEHDQFDNVGRMLPTRVPSEPQGRPYLSLGTHIVLRGFWWAAITGKITRSQLSTRDEYRDALTRV